MRKHSIWVGVVVLALFAAGSAYAGHVYGEFPTRGALFAAATVDACENNPGPFITLEGELVLGGVNGRLIFRNNAKGTHQRTEDVTADVVLLDEGETISFAKQPSRGGVGGNPWIYLQFFDMDWEPLSDELLLGRCVQGLVPVTLDFLLPTSATVEVTGGCSNSPGPYINLEGEIALSGINGKLIFRNNEKGTHEFDEFVDVDIQILPPGETISFAKQPPLGGVGGNPRIYFQFTSERNSPLGNEVYLGKCTHLGK